MNSRSLPIKPGILEIDPADPEVLKIVSTICVSAGPIAHIFQAAGYPIPTHAEEEQGHVILWMLAQYKAHGADWRKPANEELKSLIQSIQS